ncbi:MAG: HEAT repeat domain-containing protein [Vicinamibacterales bacterium]
MPAAASVTRSPNQARVLDFARAFRSAARAVGFYPPTHQTVVAALDQVTAAARAAAADGPVCLTILPQGFLAGGVAIDTSETVVSDFAALCHRHGVGAVNLDGRATPEAWQAFLALLARRPEDVRSGGGIQRQWRALRHTSPAILEIDFGALLRGKVGGDYLELAAVISHYLETAGVGGSILDDPCAALRRAVETAADKTQAIDAVLRELRAAAQLTWIQPDQFDDVFRRAAAIGEFLSEALMAGLLERRGTPEATVGTLDVVRALVERMPDATVSKFLSRVMGDAGAATTQLAEMFRSLVPSPDRRRLIVSEAQDVTLGGNVVAQWSELERNLEAHVDRRFISDQYGDELHAVQGVRGNSSLASNDPPERLTEWIASISDEAVRELDLKLLTDLVRAESDAGRLRKTLDILHAHALEAAESGDWEAVARTLDAMQGVVSGSPDRTLRVLASEALERLGASPAAEHALTALPGAAPGEALLLVGVLAAIGAPLMPAIARRWAAEHRLPVRGRFEQAVTAAGKAGRDGLRRLLASDAEAANVRVAAIRLLDLTPGTEHLPALEAALSDADDSVRAEAFRALSSSGSSRASEILARGIARADPATQLTLLGRLTSKGSTRILPMLERLVPQIDPQAASVPVCLALISALAGAGGADGERLLADHVARTRWRTPLRTWRLRSAASAAIRTIRLGGAGEARGGPARPPAERTGGGR